MAAHLQSQTTMRRSWIVLFILSVALTAQAIPTASQLDVDQAIQRLREFKEEAIISQEESRLRKEFFDRVIFQINTHYKGGSLHEFLAVTYAEMAKRQPTSPMYDFLIQASELMRLRQERFENAVELTHRFIQAGGILKPLSAEQFLAAQAYTNGERSEAAQGVSKEELGDYIDRIEIKPTPLSAQPILKTVEIQE